MGSEASLRRTSLYDAHVAAGARLVPFAGWEMPVQYSGVGEEHMAVRTRAGLFDVSHMGEIWIEGHGALELVQRVITNDASRLSVGQGLYTPMCTPEGGIIDDVTVFRTAEGVYLMVVNAATRAKDLAWIEEHAAGATVRDASDETAFLALQGPSAEALLAAGADADLGRLSPFHLRDDLMLAGVPITITRTGYTGEDGFEIACAWDDAPDVWAALLQAGKPLGLQPAGLGARDTLRLEAGLMLYGQDIDETTSPLEAPLGWTVKLDKGPFIGRETLQRQRIEGVSKRLVGFEPTEQAIPRQHYPIRADGGRLGEVTSGTFAPFLRRALGMGYVPLAFSTVGTDLGVEVRGKIVPARVVRLPFYKRPRPDGATR
ncbi:MAG TPA: glycine cleavage system aminomethyltransferase GcvT [bacterium]|nr:glycine cleavage system aminomethyltransferase GcvT [bacterium]